MEFMVHMLLSYKQFVGSCVYHIFIFKCSVTIKSIFHTSRICKLKQYLFVLLTNDPIFQVVLKSTGASSTFLYSSKINIFDIFTSICLSLHIYNGLYNVYFILESGTHIFQKYLELNYIFPFVLCPSEGVSVSNQQNGLVLLFL